MTNDIKHPEAWEFFESQARNITTERELKHLGNYRIPVPDKSGEFIYAEDTRILWLKFIDSWYNIESLDAPTVRGKIQYITHNF